MAGKIAEYKKGERVNVLMIGPGVVFNIRRDDRREAIYDIALDDRTLTENGTFVAREFELRKEDAVKQ